MRSTSSTSLRSALICPSAMQARRRGDGRYVAESRGSSKRCWHQTLLSLQALGLRLLERPADRDDHELRRLQRREADHHVGNAGIDVALARRRGIALHEVSLPRGTSLKGAVAEKPVHERADI